jgi:hypothetical protein
MQADHLVEKRLHVKKLLALAVVAGGVLFAVKRKKKSSQAEAELWREATAPTGSSLNGKAPKAAESARTN